MYDKESAFLNEEFTIWTHELGITHGPRTAYSPWTNGKVEIQNKHLGAHFQIFFDQANSNWSNLAPKLAFAYNTKANTRTGLTPYEIVFGQKPQIPISLNLGFIRSSDLTCNSEFSPLHKHSEQSSKNDLIEKLLKPKLVVHCLLVRINSNIFTNLHTTEAFKLSQKNFKTGTNIN